jgi:hypothetical protein
VFVFRHSTPFNFSQSACSTRPLTANRIQAVFESAHPYKPNDFLSHVVSFDKSIEFVCIRFHYESQTAHPDDALWIYGVLGQPHNASALYPVGRFSTVKEWPDGVLIVPGNQIWLIFESGNCREDATPEMVSWLK